MPGSKNLVLAIDFNRVIRNKETDEPILGAVQALKDLAEDNHIIVWSANKDLGGVSIWLTKHNVKYHEIISKPKADFYIDDRAVRFQDWNQVLRDIDYQL